MHDLVGHGLSAIAVQSGTARLALDAGKIETARTALAAVESASRAALGYPANLAVVNAALADTQGLIETEIAGAIARLGDAARADDAVMAWLRAGDAARLDTLPDPELAAALADFLTRYGQRGLGEGECSRPRWGEAAQPVLADYVADKYGDRDLTIVSPDAGRIKVAEHWSSRLDGAPLAFIHKTRDIGGANEAKANEVIADYRGGEALGVNSTPTLFIDGKLYQGARSVEELDATFSKLAK